MSLLSLKCCSLRVKSSLHVTPAQSPFQLSAAVYCFSLIYLLPVLGRTQLNFLVLLALVSDLPAFLHADLCLETPPSCLCTNSYSSFEIWFMSPFKEAMLILQFVFNCS